MNVEAVLALVGATGNTRTGEGSSANLFDGLTDQAKPASEGDVRTPILIPRERTHHGPTDLFPAVVAANAAGLHVLMRAKMHPVRSWRELIVRSSDGADLRAWLKLSPELRGNSVRVRLDKARPLVRLSRRHIGRRRRSR